jgi:pimeloyl-ACP methyl ester carboxylesterase
MGCSIGGRVVLPLAASHGKEFRAFIGIESALVTEGSNWVGSRDEDAVAVSIGRVVSDFATLTFRHFATPTFRLFPERHLSAFCNSAIFGTLRL